MGSCEQWWLHPRFPAARLQLQYLSEPPSHALMYLTQCPAYSDMALTVPERLPLGVYVLPALCLNHHHFLSLPALCLMQRRRHADPCIWPTHPLVQSVIRPRLPTLQRNHAGAPSQIGNASSVAEPEVLYSGACTCSLIASHGWLGADALTWWVAITLAEWLR
jgi:hypothetical protein